MNAQLPRFALVQFAAAVVFAAAAPDFSQAGVILNGASTWPATPAVATTADPDSPAAERGTGTDRNTAQTFLAPTTFKIDRIFIGYQNAIVDDTFNIRIFTVPDVNALVDDFLVPEDIGYAGQILLNEPVTLADTTLEAGNITSVLEFDLTGASEILLPASVGTAGYAFQIYGDTGANALAWQITSAAQASIYDGGKFFELPTGGVKNDFAGRDSSLAFTAVTQPGDFDLDGDVDGADFVAWQTNFPKDAGAVLSEGDADGDGDVDGADFVVWQTNFPFTPNPAASPVPEPGAWLLSTTCLAAWILRRKMHLPTFRAAA